MNLLTDFLKSFYDYTVDIIPYFLIALVITSLLQSFMKLAGSNTFIREAINMPKNRYIPLPKRLSFKI